MRSRRWIPLAALALVAACGDDDGGDGATPTPADRSAPLIELTGQGPLSFTGRGSASCSEGPDGFIVEVTSDAPGAGGGARVRIEVVAADITTENSRDVPADEVTVEVDDQGTPRPVGQAATVTRTAEGFEITGTLVDGGSFGTSGPCP